MSEPAPLKPVYLIVGNDRPKVRRAVQRLRRRVIAESGSDINVAAFEVESVNTAATLRAVIEAADTPGFALGTRLLLVLNAHHFKAKERKELLAYIHDPMPGTCLALEAEKWAKDDALYKTVFKAGGFLPFDLPKRYEMAGWVRERAAARRLPMGAAAARHLLDVCGEDPGHSERLEREIEKLALYCHSAEATAEDVDAVCTPDDEARIFDLMDAVGHRDRTRAFGLLETIFASGDPKEDANRILYSLLRYVRQLETAWQLCASDQSTAAKQLGVHPFTAKKLLEQLLGREGMHAQLLRGRRLVAGAQLPRGLELAHVAQQAVEDAVGVFLGVAGGEDRLEEPEGPRAVAVADRVHEVEDPRLVVGRADRVHVLGRGLGAAAVQRELLDLALQALAVPRVLSADVEQVPRDGGAHRQPPGRRAFAHPAGHLVPLRQIEGEESACLEHGLVQRVVLGPLLGLQREARAGHRVVDVGKELLALLRLEVVGVEHQEKTRAEGEPGRVGGFDHGAQRRRRIDALHLERGYVDVAAALGDHTPAQTLDGPAHLGPVVADDEVDGLQGGGFTHGGRRIARAALAISPARARRIRSRRLGFGWPRAPRGRSRPEEERAPDRRVRLARLAARRGAACSARARRARAPRVGIDRLGQTARPAGRRWQPAAVAAAVPPRAADRPCAVPRRRPGGRGAGGGASAARSGRRARRPRRRRALRRHERLRAPD